MRKGPPIRVGRRPAPGAPSRLPAIESARETPVIALRRCPTCQHYLTERDRRRGGVRYCSSCGATIVSAPDEAKKDRA